MTRTIDTQLLSMPASMRWLFLQHVLYRPSRRLLSDTSFHQPSPSPSPSPPPSPSPSPSPPTSHPPQPQPQPPLPQKPLSFLPSPSNNPIRTPTPAPSLPPALLSKTTTLLTRPPPRFLYSAPRFLNLPVNTYVPEVCILGRSNVGKSTLINALAGISTSKAGRAHGASVSSARKKPGTPVALAITSSKAGCTKTLNGYAFGPAIHKRPTPPSETAKPAAAAETAAATNGSPTPTRSSRRDAAHRNHDTTPAAALVLLDMPGYGQNSRPEWGAEIGKYLARRSMLRGAILLIDAVAGIKKGDRMVLKILRDANVRTAVVLTKADKLGYADRDPRKGVEQVGEMCESIWHVLRSLEKGAETWVEGTGWEREIWITGAGDPKKGGIGVGGAQFAIAKMAGLVEDTRVFESPVVEQASQTIVPFDQLQWAPSPAPRVEPALQTIVSSEQSTRATSRPLVKPTPKAIASFDRMMRASSPRRVERGRGRRAAVRASF